MTTIRINRPASSFRRLLACSCVLALMTVAGCQSPQRHHTDTTKSTAESTAARPETESFSPESVTAAPHTEAAYDPVSEHDIYGYPQAGVVLERIGYTVGHDGDTQTPVWVSYHLTADYVDGRKFKPRSEIRWRTDPDLPTADAATNSNYTNSGYSRGHMAMQSDLYGRSEECEKQGMLMSNVCPQRQAHNGGIWLALETQCKRWACQYGEIWILGGPIFADDPPQRLDGKTPAHVAIPTGFYRIIVRTTGAESDADTTGLETLAFAIIHEPAPPASTCLDEFLVSIDDIEAAAGLDFLWALDDVIESTFEAEIAVELWPDDDAETNCSTNPGRIRVRRNCQPLPAGFDNPHGIP